MKRIEDIKEFKDIDTYYEISKIVEEVFQDRVEAHKHLVTANKEIESQKRVINGMIDNEEKYCLEINRLNNKINELEETLAKIKDLNTMKYLRDDIFKDMLNEILRDSDKNG